jgi:nucleotide-binding universal stress UspA family protein
VKTILLPLDFSDVTEPAVRMAEVYTAAFDAKAYLLHVVVRDAIVGLDGGMEYIQDDTEQQEQQLATLVERFEAQDYQAESLLRRGEPVKTILEQIDQLKPDLVIMGTHGHGAVYELLLGSISEGVMRKSPCPVLMVPSPGRH